MEEVTRLALRITLPVIAVFAVPHALLWGIGSLLEPLGRLLTYALLLPVLAVSIVIHEGLHGVGFWLFGRAPLRAIAFGMKWEYLTPYAHCRVPIRARGYRIAVLLPGLITGVLPALAGIGTGIGWLTLYGILMTTAALGDVLVCWAIRHVPPQARVVDHPSEAGCLVLREEDNA
ncbi:MAG: DUF3267 domain-containing protein [Anaerolineae bacterium]